MIRPITRREIIDGMQGHPFTVDGWIPCNMFAISKRQYKCNMWRHIYGEVGGIGFLAYEDDKIVGKMVFMPKKYARKIGLSTSPKNDNLEKTVVIGCLFVLREYGNRGIATAMIKELIGFCGQHGYTSIEACVDLRPPDESGINTSFFPFRKFGFVVDDTSEGWEFKPETRMCYLNLKD